MSAGRCAFKGCENEVGPGDALIHSIGRHVICQSCYERVERYAETDDGLLQDGGK